MKGWLTRLLAVTWARSLEFLRDRSSLGWNLLFPLLMVGGMAMVFSGPGRPVFNVAVLADQPLAQLDDAFLRTDATRFFLAEDAQAMIAKVERHQVDLLLDLRPSPVHYWVNPQSPKGRILEAVLKGSHVDAQAERVSGRAIRYVDWLAPGVLGMNMMFSCLFGIGYVIVRYRKSGYLKRLNATPLRAAEFISAQLVSRLLLIMTVTVLVFAVCKLVLDLRVEGGYLPLLLVTMLGAMSMISLSLLVAARVTSEELSGGLLNLISWPMMILSGVFFPLDGAPAFVQAAAKLFPLTWMLDGARAVMLDGASLADIALPLAVLAGMTAVALALGAGLFRWTQD